MPKRVELPDGTIGEFPDSMSDDEILTVLRREFPPQQAAKPESNVMVPAAYRQAVESGADPIPDSTKRQVGLTGRAIVEGVADLAAPFANPLAYLGNKAIEGAEALGLNEPGGFRFPEQGQAVSRGLTAAGAPAPEGGAEQVVNAVGRFASGMAAGPRLDRAVTATLPKAPASVPVTAAGDDLASLSRQFDVPLTAGERSGSPIMQRLDAFLERIPVVGTRGFREGQQQAVKGAAGRIVRSVGEETDDAGAAIRASLNRVAEKNSTTAGKLFDRVDEAARDVKALVPNTARKQAAQEILQAEANLARSGAADDTVTAAARAALEAPELSFADARILRSRLLADIRKAERGEVSGSVNRATVASLKRLEGALEQDMDAWASAAGGRVRDTWRNANRYYRTRVVPFKDRQIRKAMDADFDADRITRLFIKPEARGTADKLMLRLDLKGKEAVRYGVLRDAFDSSLDSNGFFSPQKFRNAIERLGKTNEKVFTPSQQKELEGFARLAEAAKRAGQFKENPPTGQRLIDVALGGGAGAAAVSGGVGGFAATAGAVKALSVLTTRQPGRAILKRAADYEPGSPQMANVLRAAMLQAERIINEETEQE